MSTTTERLIHDPHARLDYTWDWAGWLADGETITSQTVTAPGLIVEGATADGTTVTAWIKCAADIEHPRTYRVVCHVVTSAGRQDDRSRQILVTDR